MNADEPDTLEVIEKFSALHPGILTYELHDNVGPAGGFHYGLLKFLEGDCDSVWLMDDDIVVKDNCLEHLQMEIVKGGEYIFPKVLKKSGEEIISFGWWGLLLSRNVVRKAGLPLKELFYWSEDTEYLMNRIPRENGIELIRCSAAVVEHLHHRSTKYSSWYYYYTTRNTLYYRIYIQKHNLRLFIYRFRKTVRMYLVAFYRILFFEDRKFRKISLIAKGTYHGLTGKIGKLVDPEFNL